MNLIKSSSIKQTILFLILLQLTSITSVLAKDKFSRKAQVEQKKFCKELEFENEKGYIIVDNIQINGSNTTYRFLFDTGCTNSWISEKVAQEIGLKKKYKRSFSDGYHEMNTDFCFTNITIAGINFKKVGCGIDNTHISGALCDIDGIIGNNIIETVAWDLSRESIKMSDKSNLFFNLKQYDQNKFENNHQIVVYFENGGGTTMLLDTGFNKFISLQKRDVKYIIKEKTIATGEGNAQEVTSGFVQTAADTILKVPGVIIGKDTIKNSIVYTEPNGTNGTNSSVGIEILDYYNIILDYPHNKYYTKCHQKEFNENDSKKVGIKCNIQGENVIIGYLYHNSDAERKGLKVGDIIESINNTEMISLINLTECEAYRRIKELISKEQVKIKLKKWEHNVTLKTHDIFINQNNK